MDPNTLLTQPLTEAELEELEAFLYSEAAPEEAMDVSMMDGFITALASGPNLMLPSTLVRWIWDAADGAATPTFADRNQAVHMFGLIMRHWNDVNEMLNEAPDAYEPLTYVRESNGKQVRIIDAWCMGYYRGIALDPHAWAPLLEAHPEWFSTMLLYGTEDGWQELERRNFSNEEHQAMADSLAESVRNVHGYFLERRREQVARGEVPSIVGQTQPFRRSAKVGRNDPCPCGSGKKHKRCHGAGDIDANEQPTPSVEPFPLRSPLCQRIAREGTCVDIEIYEDGAGGWLLEVVDEFGNSTVWNNSFLSDHAALAEVMHAIDTDGIASLVGKEPVSTTRH